MNSRTLTDSSKPRLIVLKGETKPALPPVKAIDRQTHKPVVKQRNNLSLRDRFNTVPKHPPLLTAEATSESSAWETLCKIMRKPDRLLSQRP